MLDAFFGRFTISKTFNMLPTPSRRRLDTFKAKWRKLNLDIVAKARTVWGRRSSGSRCHEDGSSHRRYRRSFTARPSAFTEVLNLERCQMLRSVFTSKHTHLSFRTYVAKLDMNTPQFLETMDELLFTNIDVTSTVIAFLLINIAANQSFQSSLREEIAAKQSQPSYNLSDYVLEKDTLLHYAAMESVRMSPALCKSKPPKCCKLSYLPLTNQPRGHKGFPCPKRQQPKRSLEAIESPPRRPRLSTGNASTPPRPSGAPTGNAFGPSGLQTSRPWHTDTACCASGSAAGVVSGRTLLT